MGTDRGCFAESSYIVNSLVQNRLLLPSPLSSLQPQPQSSLSLNSPSPPLVRLLARPSMQHSKQEERRGQASSRSAANDDDTSLQRQTLSLRKDSRATWYQNTLSEHLIRCCPEIFTQTQSLMRYALVVVVGGRLALSLPSHSVDGELRRQRDRGERGQKACEEDGGCLTA